jgi:pentatricopeptide repeat protein
MKKQKKKLNPTRTWKEYLYSIRSKAGNMRKTSAEPDVLDRLYNKVDIENVGDSSLRAVLSGLTRDRREKAENLLNEMQRKGISWDKAGNFVWKGNRVPNTDISKFIKYVSNMGKRPISNWRVYNAILSNANVSYTHIINPHVRITTFSVDPQS